MKKSVINFSAGPAMLPASVMEQAQAEFRDWNHLGLSVMELSHRSPEFLEIVRHMEQVIRTLLQLPDDYHVLFMPGGAQAQYAAIPLNCLPARQTAAYVQTGLWSQIAIAEAQRFASVEVVANSEAQHYCSIPDVADWLSCEGKGYLHYVDNETVDGVEFARPPELKDVPIVVDMSSNLLTRPIDVTCYDMIYACAQKNLGPAGVTVVIMRDSFFTRYGC